MLARWAAWRQPSRSWSTFQPSEKAKAAGAAVEVDISALKDGEKLTVEWRGKPVWIIKRTPEQIKELPELDSQLADPQSKRHPGRVHAALRDE